MDEGSVFLLEDSVEAGDTRRVRELLQGGADANSVCHGLDVPVAAIAFRHGDAEMLRLLHEQGADLDACSNRPILHAAASSFDDNALLPLLIELGWDPDSPDDRGWTPLHFAAAAGYERNVNALLESGAYPVSQTSDGLLASTIARRNGHEQIAERLERVSPRR
jgi:ankyrin repeat protein